MSTDNLKMNRRKALGWGVKGFLGTQLGLTGINLAGSMLPRNEIFARLKAAAAVGTPEAFASVAKAKVNVVMIHFMDKLHTLGICGAYPQDADSIAARAARQNGYNATGQSYRGRNLEGSLAEAHPWGGFGFNRCFGEGLDMYLPGGLPDGVAMIMFPSNKQGNHTLADSRISDEHGSLMYSAVATGKAGPMGSINFNVDGNATDGNGGMQGPGGVPQEAFDTTAQVRTLLQRSVASLKDPASAEGKLMAELNSLASSGFKPHEILEEIRQASKPAVSKLLDAMANPDAVHQQIDAILALRDTGLASVFCMGIGTADMNGGGSFDQAGGDTIINGYNMSATQAHAALGEAFGRLLKEAGTDTFITTGHDGGRSDNGGDNGRSYHFVLGPSKCIRSAGMGNWRAYNLMTNNDNNLLPILLSNGSTVREVTPAMVQTFVMHAAYGVELGPYPVEMGGVKLIKKPMV